MKQLKLTFLLTLLMSMVGVDAFAYCAVANADGVTIYYNILNDGYSVTYSSLNKYTGNVVIPACVVKEYRQPSDLVISIGDYAFQGCTGLTSVTIPGSVKSIGEWAFSGCTGLTSINIPSSVTSIGLYAFYGCTELTSVHISDLTAWCKIKFSDYYSNPLICAHHLYLNGEEVKELVIPNSVISIGEWAFLGCTGLTSINIPSSVTSIGSSAFKDCTELTSVHISDLTAWCKIKFSNYYSNPLIYAHHLYLNGEEVKELVIPNSVKSIGEWAFSGCTGLTSINIPSSVTSIGSSAFKDCTELISIHISDLTAWCKIKFSDNYSNPLIYAHHLYLNGEEVKELVIPNSVKSIGEWAFSGCTGLTSITIPSSVTNIGRYAFDSCTGLTSITIPNSVATIDWGAFNSCTGLTSITIPNSVRSIGKFAFRGCTSVTRLISYAAKPPICGYLAFDGINKQNCILSVPEESVSMYKQADQWKEFFIIEPIPTGLQDIFLDNQESATIYDLNGRKMKEPHKGFNIINGKKVWVK